MTFNLLSCDTSRWNEIVSNEREACIISTFQEEVAELIKPKAKASFYSKRKVG